jgi:hypothetical protein
VAEQQQRWYVSTDPNFGEPITPRGDGGYVSTDPNFGEPVQVKSRTWADRAGMNEPTSSMLTGFLRGAGAGALDLLQGATANVTGQLNTKLDAENAIRGESGLPQTGTAPRVEQPEGFSGAVGAALPMVGEMALGGAPAVKTAVNAIPRAARAGEKFQEVMGAAKNVVIDNAEVGDSALRVAQLADRGGSMPMAVRKLINYSTDPAKPQMTYEVARDFASNISRLSVDEYKRMTPVVAREVSKLSAALNKANAAAAQSAGKGAEYKAAMREYARAKRIEDAISATLSGAKKALPLAGAAGAGAWLTGKIVNAIQGQ